MQAPPQLIRPLLQESTQSPAEHTWPEAQAVPDVLVETEQPSRAPQYLGSTCGSMQVAPHCTCPGKHETLHTPFAQI